MIDEFHPHSTIRKMMLFGKRQSTLEKELGVLPSRAIPTTIRPTN